MASPSDPSRPRDLREFRDDLRASLEARRELGPEMDDMLISSFIQRLDREIDARLDARIGELSRGRAVRQRGTSGWAIAATMLFSFPLVGIAGQFAGAVGVVFALVIVLLFNIMWALRRQDVAPYSW